MTRILPFIAIVLLWCMAAGCSGIHPRAADHTGPGSRSCPQWQSYANCAQNH